MAESSWSTAAKAGLVRQQLLRGDPAAADGLAEMQRDLATTLQDVREIAYAIHPPVLSDRGLLEAIEAQSSRLALPMAVRADLGLRGVRFGAQIEVTAWYVLAEALSNVVKHAGASEVEVSLSQEDGRLGLVAESELSLEKPETGTNLTTIQAAHTVDFAIRLAGRLTNGTFTAADFGHALRLSYLIDDIRTAAGDGRTTTPTADWP